MYQQRSRLLALWRPVGMVILLFALFEFFQDIFRPDWPAWVMPPLLMVSFAAGISLAKRDGLAKYALWMSALALAAFVLIYDLLDFMLDPIFASDIGVAALTAVVMLVLWQLFAGIVAVEEA